MGACAATRVAIISDTHGFIDPRIAEVVRSCDVAVHAGDIGDAGVLRALQRLAAGSSAWATGGGHHATRAPRRRGADVGLPLGRVSGNSGNLAARAVSRPAGTSQPGLSAVVAVRGNNDTAKRWGTSAKTMLAALPEEAVLDLPGGPLVIVHGHRAGKVAGRHARLRRAYPQARAVVYGHSHRLVCDQSQCPWVLNPGAAGRARTYGGPSCLVLHTAPRDWGVEAVRFTN